MRQPSWAFNVFTVVAIAAFLLFSGISLYPVLWPVHHWDVACPTPKSGIQVLSTKTLEFEEGYMELLKARKCTMTPIRQFLWEGLP